MKVLNLILPKKNNQGREFDYCLIQSIEHEIIKIAGGYSKNDIQGAWKDQETNKVYLDNNTSYEIIVESDKQSHDILTLASDLKTILDQESILVKSYSQDVMFI